jgi:hypothetical protein
VLVDGAKVALATGAAEGEATPDGEAAGLEDCVASGDAVEAAGRLQPAMIPEMASRAIPASVGRSEVRPVDIVSWLLFRGEPHDVRVTLAT